MGMKISAMLLLILAILLTEVFWITDEWWKWFGLIGYGMIGAFWNSELIS